MDERTLRLLGEEALEKLKKSHVAVCGLGGVGSYAVEALARASVGNIELIDFDRVDPTNINRQLFALNSTIGKFKADVAALRIHDINPSCNIKIRKVFIDEENISSVISEKVNCIVDAIDSVNSKVALLSWAYKKGIYTVSSMGAALRTDTEKVKISDISKTNTCPLARIIRSRLRKNGIEKGIDCVFSSEKSAVEESLDQRNSPLGSISFIPSLFGLKIAGAVINKLIGHKNIL